MIRASTRTARLAILGLSLAIAVPGGAALGSGSATKAATHKIDAFAYCVAVKNRDVTDRDGPISSARLTPSLHTAVLRIPEFASQRGPDNIVPFWWRCIDGSVFACLIGASGAACTQKVRDAVARPTIAQWCRENPNSNVPRVASSGTASSWKCVGIAPVVEYSAPVDKRGYLVGAWIRVPPPAP